MNFPRNGRQVYACHALYNPNIESPFHIDIVTSSNMKSMFCSRILILFSQTLENLKRDRRMVAGFLLSIPLKTFGLVVLRLLWKLYL